MAGVVGDAEFLLDQLSHTPCRPHFRSVSERLRTALERTFELAQIGSTKLWLASGAASLFQPGASVLLELGCPSADRLAMYTDTACYFRLRNALAQQARRLHPPPLQLIKVSAYTCWIAHERELTIENSVRHYIR